MFVGIQKAVEYERNEHENIAENFSGLDRKIITVSVEESLLVIKPLPPTMIRPIIAAPQPK